MSVSDVDNEKESYEGTICRKGVNSASMASVFDEFLKLVEKSRSLRVQ